MSVSDSSDNKVKETYTTVETNQNNELLIDDHSGKNQLHHQLIYRIPREKGRRSHMEWSFIDIPVPIELKYKYECTCNNCANPATKYIHPFNNSNHRGTLVCKLNPGYKCNVCCTQFILSYMEPDWDIDGDVELENVSHIETDTNTWQSYLLISLQKK